MEFHAYIIRWWGKKQVHDETQHIFQDEVTTKLLEDMGVKKFIVGQNTGENEIAEVMHEFNKILKNGESFVYYK